MKHKHPILLCLLVFAFAILGTPACTHEDIDIDERGYSLPTYGNGLLFSPGLTLENGTSLSDGIGSAHGVNTAAPLVTSGLFSTGTPAGVLDSADGRKFVTAMIACALPTGQSISKTVSGTTYVFAGKIGVAAAWKASSCNTTCQQWISACLLSQSNATGSVTPIEIRATAPTIGTTMKSLSMTEQERAWFGNLFVNPPVAYQAWGVNVPSDPDLLARDCDSGSPCAIVSVGLMASRCTAVATESASGCTASAGGTTYLPVTSHYAL